MRAFGFSMLPYAERLERLPFSPLRRFERARDRLSLSYCLNRKRAGGNLEMLPSRFLAEIPAELMIRKSAETKLAPEESVELRKNFFANMKSMLGE